MSKQLIYSSYKSLLLSLCFLTGISFSYSQTTLNIGAKGGFNLATMFGDTYNDLGFRTGLLLGGYANMPHNDNISFQAELNYSQEGARNASYDFSTFSDVIYDQKLKYNYLNIPLLIKYHLPGGLNIQGGPQLGIRLTAKESRKIKSGTAAPTDNSAGTRAFPDRIKLIYPSLTVGAEYKVNEKLNAQARLYFSPFDNVKKNAGDSEGTFPLIFQFTVGYDLFQREVDL